MNEPQSQAAAYINYFNLGLSQMEEESLDETLQHVFSDDILQIHNATHVVPVVQNIEMFKPTEATQVDRGLVVVFRDLSSAAVLTAQVHDDDDELCLQFFLTDFEPPRTAVELGAMILMLRRVNPDFISDEGMNELAAVFADSGDDDTPATVH
jgi:hypothetical protein